MTIEELKKLEIAVGSYVSLFRGQITLAGVLWVVWAMGYRKTVEAIPLPPVEALTPQSAPKDDLPPPTPSVDELFKRLS